MKTTLIVGLLLFTAFAVVFAPASLLRVAIPSDARVDLLAPAGTIWRGHGNLLITGTSAGQVSWRFRPTSVVQGTLGYDLELSGPEHAATGRLLLGGATATIDVDGRAAAAFINRWLAAYDIALSGDFTLNDIRLRAPYQLRGSTGGAAAGNLTWTGGPLQYQLAGRLYHGELPPLVAHLGDGLEGVVYQDGGHTPLLQVELQNNGFLRISMTALLTRLVGNPWPGSHAEHEVVLEVEEPVF